MSNLKREADDNPLAPEAKNPKLSTTPSPLQADSSMLAAMGGRLPNEILDKIFAAALEPETKPVINFLEANFSRTNVDTGFPDPAFYLPTCEGGGEDICKLSYYRSNVNIAKTSWSANQQALQAPELSRQRAKDDGTKLVEITAHINKDDPTGKTLTIQLDPSKDLLCLQVPLRNKSWFQSPPEEPWSWSSETFFRPLWPSGIDKMERLAIDWKTETSRGTLSPICENNICEFLSNMYNRELYLIHGWARKYCSVCTGVLLDGMNAMCETFDALQKLVGGEFSYLPGGFCGLGAPPDDGGFFVCGYCRVTYPGAEGRDTQAIWKPKCVNWHRPVVQSDIATLFMGRMRRMSEFYIVCTDIALKTGRRPPRGNAEFVGNGVRFVVVEEDDDRWDLSKARENGGISSWPNAVCEVDPFRYAEWLEDVAWESYWRFPRIYATRSREVAEADDEIMQDARDNWEVQLAAYHAVFGDGNEDPIVGEGGLAGADESGEGESESVEDEDDEETDTYGYWNEWLTGVDAPPNRQWPMTAWFGQEDEGIPETFLSLSRKGKFYPVRCRVLACIRD